LVILGHGSTLNAESGATVYQHAADLRSRNLFGEVREAFWKQEPNVRQVLAAINAPRIFVVPFFISEGYFSDEVIPRELGFPPGHPPRTQERGATLIIYCRAVGTHENMTRILLNKAGGIVARFPFPRAPKPSDTTLFIAGHGTEKNENSRQPMERQAELIRELNIYADVRAVFLEEEPGIRECYTLAQTRNVIVVPFFISDGMHAQEDIPILLGEPERVIKQRLQNGQPPWRNPTERKGKRIWYATSVGNDPEMAEIILARVREASLEPGK
jgi:sirohydrochlorin cobaltochelatase